MAVHSKASRQRVALAVKNKGQRAMFRQKLGALNELVISEKSLKRYNLSIKYFFEFCELNGIRLATSTHEIDAQLQLWIETLWAEGEPRSWVSNCLSGLHHHLTASLKGHIKGAWRLHQTWVRREVPARAVPFLPQQVQAVAAFFMFHLNLPRTAAMILLGYHCVLRTAEILEATSASVVVYYPPGKGIVRFDSKSGSRLGFTEARTIDDKVLCALLKHVKSSMLPGDRFINVTGQVFRQQLAKAIIHLGLDPAEYKGYSIRRGGATHDFRSHGNFKRTQDRGGWSNPRTAKIYINNSLALLRQLEQSPAEVKKADALVQHLTVFLSKLT